jgi:two-component system response regulator DevR
MRRQVLEPEWLGLGDEQPEHPSPSRSRTDDCFFVVTESNGQKLLQAGAVLVQNAERPIVRIDQGASLHDDVTEKGRQVYVRLNHEDGVHETAQLLGIFQPSVGHLPDRTQQIPGPPIVPRSEARVDHWHNGSVTIRIFLLDDHDLVREGIRSLLEVDDELEVVGEAATAEEALTRIPLANPDVALLDVRLESGSGIEVCREVRSLLPGLVCLMLTSFADDEALFASVMAGASGYVLKQITSRDLIDDVKRVAGGASLIDPRAVARVVERIANPPNIEPTLGKLSPQERRLLDLIAEGKTNRQCAEEMFLSEKTVKNYVTNLLAKLALTSRTEAAIYATKLKSDPLGRSGPAPT